ncbi:hypothetical protein ACIA2T_12775 [Amycolatopsis japonica]|uniref:hypothetical protein n=1 Tax=Amycolatopsis japonica TaxID=208439 RepID=UPI0037967A06
MIGRLDIAKVQVELAFGPKIAKRLGAFDDGTLYVSAGGWAELAAWLVDFVVYLLCAGIGFVVFAVATRNSAIPDSAPLLTLLGLMIGVPVLYGLFFGNGRVLGAEEQAPGSSGSRTAGGSARRRLHAAGFPPLARQEGSNA